MDLYKNILAEALSSHKIKIHIKNLKMENSNKIVDMILAMFGQYLFIIDRV